MERALAGGAGEAGGAGAEEAYRVLVERYQRPVYTLVLRMVRDAAVAEELTQDVFVKAFANLASFRTDRKFSSWLFKIAHNRTIDHLRRGRPDTVPLDSDDPDAWSWGERLADESVRDPETEASRSDLAHALDAAVAELRPEYREVVLLRFAEGMAYQEIAEVADLPIGTVKTYIHRARKELAQILTAAGWGDRSG